MSNIEGIMIMVNSIGAYTMVALVVFIGLWMNYKKRVLHSQEIIAAIDKGADIPFPAPKERNYRNLGLIWTLVGFAIFIAIWVQVGDIQPAIWGLLPFSLGIAFLLIHKGQKKKEDDVKELP
ncbi:MAG: hypothetical protein H8D23_01485 [Candidatus Brocadiales bacterium]|nr:hypothetical protein [Candidatus Brocadiales bacterium]